MNKVIEDKMITVARKIGMEGVMMNEDMIWAMRKTMMGASMMIKTMKDGGMSEGEAMDMMKKISDIMTDKDTMTEMEEIRKNGEINGRKW